MPFAPGDSVYNLVWKLVEAAGGIPRPGDSERDLLAKYLTAIGGTPITGDTFYDLLVKILRAKGGAPQPGDTPWLLLVKWLQIEGECRKCGDSIYDLWRKLLALGESNPPVVNGLLAGLTGYWKFDESSGTRVDSHASYDLAQTGSVTATPAALNNGAEFFASELDFLANTSDDLNTHSGDFSVSVWIKIVNITEGVIFTKGGFPTGGWGLFLTASPAFALDSYDSEANGERCESSVIVSTGVFYHVATSYNSLTGVASIWVNGVKTEDGHLSAADSVAAFLLGKDTTVVVDEMAIWIGRTLTDADVTFLRNGGTPLPYESFN